MAVTPKSVMDDQERCVDATPLDSVFGRASEDPKDSEGPLKVGMIVRAAPFGSLPRHWGVCLGY